MKDDLLYAELQELRDRQRALDEAHRGRPLDAETERERQKLRKREAEIDCELRGGLDAH